MSDADRSPAARTTRMWEAGESVPSVEILMSYIDGGTLRERTDAILVDQKFRWQQGMQVSAEHYFHRCPDLAADPQSRWSIVAGEFTARGGTSLLVRELTDRFPDLADELRELVS